MFCNLMGVEKLGWDVYGGVLIDDWWVLVLLGVVVGLCGWDQDSFYIYLCNGYVLGIVSVLGLMVEVVYSL